MEPKGTVQASRRVQPLGGASSGEPDAAFASIEIDQLRTAVEDVRESVEQLYQQANRALTQQAQRNPHLMLAAAAGLGFVLGGGLASRTGSLLMRVGGRVVLARLLHGWWKNFELPSGSKPEQKAD